MKLLLQVTVWKVCEFLYMSITISLFFLKLCYLEYICKHLVGSQNIFCDQIIYFSFIWDQTSNHSHIFSKKKKKLVQFEFSENSWKGVLNPYYL